MAKPVTLFTGQWADLPFEEVCQKASAWGYDGLEIACWGDHMDVRKAASDRTYAARKLRVLKKYNLQCWALGAHLAGQCVGDVYDKRLDAFVPEAVKGRAKEIRAWAVEEMKASARAARAMGCYVVNGLAHLEVPLFVPSDDRGDGPGRLRDNQETLDAHPGCF